MNDGVSILDKEVKVYKTDNGQFSAKGVVYTMDGKLETEEFTADTEKEAREKAENALIVLLAKTTGKKAD